MTPEQRRTLSPEELAHTPLGANEEWFGAVNAAGRQCQHETWSKRDKQFRRCPHTLGAYRLDVGASGLALCPDHAPRTPNRRRDTGPIEGQGTLL